MIAGALAKGVNAQQLVILTGVENVYLNYEKEDQTAISEMNCQQAQEYMDEGQFKEGTMRPKIETAIDFIGDSAIRSVLITKLDTCKKALSGQGGTVIKK